MSYRIIPFIVLFFLIFSNSFALSLRFAEFSPNRGIRAAALEKFAYKLKQQSKGELNIQFFWGGSLLKTKSILKGVGDGVADLGSVIGFLNPKKLSLYTIGDLPLANSDEWVGLKAMYELTSSSNLLQAEFFKAKVIYLTNYTTGPIQLICKKPLQGIKDLANLKIRSSGAYAKIFASLGASSQSLPQPAVYQALQTGLIDCNQNYYYSIKAYKQYEVAEYLTELDWGQNMSFGIVINQNTFLKLSKSQQTLLKKLSAEFINDFAKIMIENKQMIKQELQKKQLKIKRINKSEKELLEKSSDFEIEKWLEKNNKSGKKLFRDYLMLIKKYQQEKKDYGYPWQRN